jgi:hypothetical protein
MHHIVFILGLIALSNPLNAQDNCLQPDWTFETWTAQYNASVPVSEAVHAALQPAAFFAPLVTLPDVEPVSFMAWDDAGTQQTMVTLDDPVIVVTWTSTPTSGSFAWQRFRQLQQYTCGPHGNPWFTIHGDAFVFLDNAFPGQRACFNPRTALGCEAAIHAGVPSVGVPFGFSDPDGPNPSDPWWREFVMIGVVDRSSLIRPSLNPTVDANPVAQGGAPIWDEIEQTYRLARAGDGPIFEAQQAAAKSFVGYIDGPSGTRTYAGWNGFAEWLAEWGTSSWSQSGRGPSGFPYTMMGRTWDWLPRDGFAHGQPALSEFILMGSQSIYVIGTRSGAAYLFDRSEDPSVVPWCDTCPGDLNVDGRVDGEDLSILLSSWSTTNPCANLSKNERLVGPADLGMLLANWTGSSAACPGWPAALASLRPANCE